MTSYNYYWPPAPNSGYTLTPCHSQPAPALEPRAQGPHNVLPMTQSPTPPSTAANQAPITGTSTQGIFLKVINPNNKKDWQDYTLRGISRDTMDTPTKMRQTIVDQCGEDIVPEEIGYFVQATKHWIHNRLDMTDVWDKWG